MNKRLSLITHSLLKLSFLLFAIVVFTMFAADAKAVKFKDFISLKADYVIAFSKRSSPAKSIKKSPIQLLRDGYVRIGELSVVNIHQNCTKRAGKKKKCKKYKYREITTDKLLKYAARNGADVVLLSEDNKDCILNNDHPNFEVLVQNIQSSTGSIWRKDKALFKRAVMSMKFYAAVESGKMDEIKKLVSMGLPLNEHDLGFAIK